jgi:hypothetical protein
MKLNGLLDVQKIVFLCSEKQLETTARNMKHLTTNQVLHVTIIVLQGVKLSIDFLRILKSRKIWNKKH